MRVNVRLTRTKAAEATLQGWRFPLSIFRRGRAIPVCAAFVAAVLAQAPAHAQCSASGSLPIGASVTCSGAQTTGVGQGPGANNVTVTANNGASVLVTNANAISLGNNSSIVLGDSGPPAGGSSANPSVLVRTTTNGGATNGNYGDGDNTIDIGSNSTILINRNAAVVSAGTQSTSEAINPYGSGNTIINYGLNSGRSELGDLVSECRARRLAAQRRHQLWNHQRGPGRRRQRQCRHRFHQPDRRSGRRQPTAFRRRRSRHAQSGLDDLRQS